jgi:methylase of polypeptide subunit release factors
VGILNRGGQSPPRAPDERFIDRLESALERPIALNLEELTQRYAAAKEKAVLDGWMRDEMGWTIVADAEGVRELLERAAKFACYSLVIKLVFYEALLKRYANRMHALSIPAHEETAAGLGLHLEGLFREAREVTRGYESVFGEDHAGVGSRIPFYSDAAVAPWRELIDQIHEFDFSKLDYEVIGTIFERLIGPEERHKYGQYYTRVEVVDLINSFCIRRGDEKVMDPSCGGGTFLVRAYARMRELNPARNHRDRLIGLYGVDRSRFAAHLTTINLATRDLIDEENYPLVVRSDFFDVRSDKAELRIRQLDAVIGNPPYVRQEDIRRSPRRKGGPRLPQRGTLEYYSRLVRQEADVKLSGRSDLHCYFWPHAASLLSDDGWLCFVTSSQWLDVEYGFRLQEWILRNFQVVAILESVDEPWFTGARVASTVTILRRQRDAERRAANVVGFIQVRRPMQEILKHDGGSWDAVRVTDEFRDEILTLTENTVEGRYRARLVPQAALWSEGVRLGAIMRRMRQVDPAEPAELEGTEGAGTEPGGYFGGKWGVFLRAPDLWFDLLDRHGGRFAPLGEIATLWRGVTTGKDVFFFPRDATAVCLGKEETFEGFERAYGVARSRVESGEVKLVKCGEGYGEIRPIEARFLEPEVHSLMEVTGYSVTAADCSRMILLVGQQKEALEGTFALEYILWGEKQGWHEAQTTRQRVTATRAWYDLTGHARGSMFWPKSQQYKHAVPANPDGLQANCNLYNVQPKGGIEADVLAGVLNSSVVVLSKFQYGRPVGVEANLKTEVVDTNMMLVPDPRQGTEAARARVAKAFAAMKGRRAMQFLSERRMREMALGAKGRRSELAQLRDESELDQPDRHELDDAVLELLGIRIKAERTELLTHLYGYLEQMFEQLRAKEEKGIGNKNRTRRRGAVRPDDIAEKADTRTRP